jgi:hypothetical protein
MSDNLTLLIMVAILGTGGAVGYITRIVQKVQDRRDTIYLKHLPTIYYSLTVFIEASTAFSSNSCSVEDYFASIQHANKKIEKIVFSSEIIMFKEDLHKRLVRVYEDMGKLKSIVENVKKSTEAANTEIFRQTLSKGGSFEQINPRDIVFSAADMKETARLETSKYKSFSWLLIVLVIISAIAVGIVDILKDSI